MQNNPRSVYTYRSWWKFTKACACVIFGPIWASVTVQDLLQKSTLHHRTGLEWVRWFFPLAVAVVVFDSLVVMLSAANERIVLEGSKLEYYNKLRIKKISIDVAEVEEIEKVAGAGCWQVFTPQGRFSFSRELRGYQELLQQLAVQGKSVNRIPRL